MSTEGLSEEGWANYATSVSVGGSEAELSPEAFGPVVKERNPKLCAGNNQTCKAYKARGTNFCVGHLRKMGETE